MIELILLKADQTQAPIEAMDPTPENLVAAFLRMDELEIEIGSDELGFDQCDYVCVKVFGVAVAESLNARIARHPMTLKEAKATLAMWPEVAEWQRMKAAQDEAAAIEKSSKASSTVTDPRRGTL